MVRQPYHADREYDKDNEHNEEKIALVQDVVFGVDPVLKLQLGWYKTMMSNSHSDFPHPSDYLLADSAGQSLVCPFSELLDYLGKVF